MKKSFITAIVLFLGVYIAPLGVRPLVIPDETRYAEIPREMLATGDWTVPHLDGLRYFEKPVLGYWLNAVSIKLFGENAFAVRFPSAMAVGVSALMLFWLIRKTTGDAASGLLAAALLLTFIAVFGIGTFAVLDSVFSMFITVCMGFVFLAYRQEQAGRKALYFALSGVFCGLAFLTKGFIAFAIPCVIVVPFFLWMRDVKGLLKSIWRPILVAILIALPWSIAIHRREPDFWHYFFWEEHIRRFTSHEAQHAQPFWFYIPVLAGGALPWTGAIPPVWAGLKKTQLKEPLVRFAMCWCVFPFLFFSASRGKLTTYILPCYPPLAILMTLGLLQFLTEEKTPAFIKKARGSAWLALLLGAALLVSQTVIPATKIYRPAESWKWILLVIGFMFYAACLLIAAKQKCLYRHLAYCCIGPAVIMTSISLTLPDRIRVDKMPERLIEANANQIQTGTILISDNYTAPAVNWFLHRKDAFILAREGEFTYGLSYNSAEHRHIDIDDMEAFIERNLAAGADITFITSARRYEDYKQKLPDFSQIESIDGFVCVTIDHGEMNNVKSL